jgi:hypothetical protein
MEIDPATLRLVAQCLNHYATPGTEMFINIHQNTRHHIPKYLSSEQLFIFTCVFNVSKFQLRGIKN